MSGLPEDLDRLIYHLQDNGWELSGTQSYANGIFYTNMIKGSEKIRIEYECWYDEEE